MSGVGRVARAAVGVIVLLGLVFLVNNWWGDYRRGDPPDVVAETTPTPEGAPETPAEPGEVPAEEPAASGATVNVLIEGLNFRKEPSREGELIRGLNRGTRLELLGTADGWHHVRDDAGVEGYVSASEQYTEVQQ
jgi:hypothetical protein